MPTTGHASAAINGTVIAETDVYEFVDGNVYFPPSSIKTEHFTKTDLHTHCPWKGDASYYTIKVGGESSGSYPLFCFLFFYFPLSMWATILWPGQCARWLICMADKELENAAWYYPETKAKADHFRDYVAFCKLHFARCG
jgi:uncharacterized protein (DUF427 family)